jgi:flagellar biosynthesis protein FliR
MAGDPEAIRNYVLVLARTGPVVTFAPWLSSLGVSPSVRAAFGVSLGLVFLPLAGASGPSIDSFVAALVLELLRGSVFLLGVMLPWVALDTAFGLIDSARSRSRHTGGDGQGALPAMASVLFAAVFASAGGFEVAIEGFAASFDAVPLGAAATDSHFADVTLSALRAFADALAFGVRLAVPMLLALVLMDVMVAAASRASNSFALAAAAIPVVPSVALAAACLALARSGPQLVGLIGEGLNLAVRWLSSI